MIIYIIATLVYLTYLVIRSEKIGHLATLTTLSGLIIHTTALALRTAASYQQGIGQPPFTNLYSSMVFFSWAIILTYLILEFKFKQKAIGVFVTPIAFILLAVTTLLSNQIEPLVPALQSNWLLSHVVTCFFGYAAFAVACGISIMYLVRVHCEEKGIGQGIVLKTLPPSELLDELAYKAIVIGFPFLTIGIITGAAWANYAWGTYWSWDPKETWSLITWFVYAAFLHARFAAGWKGKRTAILSIVGFLFVLFTYLGVSWLLPGLHSYAIINMFIK
ncbi:MAG: c-type cytochrome biogenesis protein CcsB [bacterium]|nr:c-type cytochrome biogenesis protein CcsB [bacterium]